MSLKTMGGAVAGMLLAPGEAVCDSLDVTVDGARDLVRMLVNTFVYMFVGVGVMLVVWRLS